MTQCKSISGALHFFDEQGNQTRQSFLYPSESVPDVKALLELIVFSVNEETGSDYKIVLDKEKVIKELMP